MEYLVRHGDGSGKTPLVFLHGWGGDRHSLDALALRLDSFDRYSLDLYGFGSTPIERVMTVDEYADGVAEWMREAAVQGAVVVAHSFGGRVAISLAARHPQCVKGLVLISSAGIRPRRGIRRFCKIAAFKLRRRLGLDVTGYGSADYRAAQGCLREVLKLAVNNHQEKQLRKISVPVLAIYGKDDRETPPRTAKKIARLVKDGASVGLSGGHFCYLDHAVTIAAAIRALAEGVV